MDLYTGDLYFPKTYESEEKYLDLNNDIECDVLIVGAGITGALVSYYMSKENLDIVVIDKNKVASGSTSASTLLLQYEIDTDLNKLQKIVGTDNANEAFKACRDAIYEVGNIVKEYNLDCDYRIMPSIYVAKNIVDKQKIKKEYTTRKDCGFEVEMLTKDELKNKYAVHDYSIGMISKDGGIINPYKFTKQLFKKLFNDNKVKIYENTSALNINENDTDVLVTTNRKNIKAKKVFFCTGYQSFTFIPNDNNIKFDNTYVAVTNVIKNNPLKDYIMWNIKRPYFYIRCTEDNRIMIGGLDDKFTSEYDRYEKMLENKDKLKKELEKTFCINDLNIEYMYSGLFASTDDGLGYIGKHDNWENCFYGLDFGGNGMLYGVLAGKAFVDIYKGKKNIYENIFSFNR